MSGVDFTSFQRKLEEKRAALAAEQNKAAPLTRDYSEDIPELDLTPNISPEQQVLDDFIARLPIVDAYLRWGGTSQINGLNRKEIKVSCPNPQHTDNSASCALNTEKNVFMCFVCGGGDVWDIAAWGKGYDVPGYKKDAQTFRRLREEIGKDFGIAVQKNQPGVVTVREEDLAPAPAPTQIPTPANSDAQEEEFNRRVSTNRRHPKIDWRAIVPEETFLREYLDAATIDDCPEEFHFWAGLMALGLAVGRTRTLEDSPEVVANLYVCYTGGTGTGKSKAKRHLTNIIRDELPYKRDADNPTGTRHLKGAESGQVIVDRFIHPVMDPVTSKIHHLVPGIRGCLDFEEMSEIIGKGKRQGSTLKQMLMNLYDAPRHISSDSKTHGDSEAELPFGSVITTTQLKSIRILLNRSDDASGFANRWVYATGVLKEQFAVNRVKHDFNRAGGILRLINATAKSHETVTWTEAAEKLWTEFFKNVVMPFRYDHQDADIAQRIDLLLKKLFLLFTINNREMSVSENTVRSVLTLYPHLLETYQIIDEQIDASVDADNEDLILRHIERMTVKSTDPKLHDRGPSVNDLHRAVKRRIPDRGSIKRITDNLMALGMIEKQVPPAGTPGRPSVRFIIKSGDSYAV